MRGRLLIAAALVAAPIAVAQGSSVTASIFTVAGGAGQGFGGDGGPATNARLDGPGGIAVLSGGSYLIADTINQRIRRVAASGRITTLAGTGQRGFSGDGGPALHARYEDPTALAASPQGDLYVADTGNNRVRVIRVNGTSATVAGSGEQGFAGDDGAAISAQLNAPSGLATDRGGDLFIADTGNNRIRELHPDGTLTTVAGNGKAGASGDGGPATRAELNAPAGLAVTATGALLIADAGNNKIRRVNSDGTIVTAAGSGGGGSAGDGGAATSAQLNMPVDVAAAPQGGFFIAEQGGNRIRYVDPTGQIVKLAGTGAPRFGGDGRSPAAAYLNAPHALEVAPSGIELLVADTDNNRIRYVATPGQANLLAVAALQPSLRAPLVKKAVTVKKRKRHILVVANIALGFSSTQQASLKLQIETKKRKPVTTLRTSIRAGASTFHLPPRLRSGKHRLAKDHYVVRVTATNGSASATTSLDLVVK